MKRLFLSTMVILMLLALAAWGSAPSKAAQPQQATAAATQAAAGPDQYGERYDADPAVLTKSVGTTDGVPKIALAALSDCRAASEL